MKVSKGHYCLDCGTFVHEVDYPYHNADHTVDEAIMVSGRGSWTLLNHIKEWLDKEVEK